MVAGTPPAMPMTRPPFTDDEVIEIVTRAPRAHLGLMENHEGRIICIRAWDVHAGLRDRGILADYDFNSVPVPRTLHPDVPRVAFITAKTDEYGELLRNGIRGHSPVATTGPGRIASEIFARASASTSRIPAPTTRPVPTARTGTRAWCWWISGRW